MSNIINQDPAQQAVAMFKDMLILVYRVSDDKDFAEINKSESIKRSCVAQVVRNVEMIIAEGACHYGVLAVNNGREKYWYDVIEELKQI
jgi:hypothetical protein